MMSVHETSSLQRSWVWFVGYTALAVSVVLAVRYAYNSADTLVDAYIRAAAAGTAAVVGAQGPAWITRSMRKRAWGTAVFSTLGFALCLAVTLAGGIGTIAASSDKSLSLRANASVLYAATQKELEALRDRRGKLPAARPVGTIQSDLLASRMDRRYQSSGSCTDATVSASRTFCAGYARLEGELETAKAAAALDLTIHELTRKLEMSPSVRAVHPQAEVIARLLGVAREDAEAWYALLFALAVEMAAMTVLLVAETTTQHRIPVVHAHLEPVVLRPTRARIMERGKVVDWLRERAVPSDHSTSTPLERLHADYEAWCSQLELSAASVEAFAADFDRVRAVPELAGNIRKRGDLYYGIKLADEPKLLRE